MIKTILRKLRSSPEKKWFITGAAGFIGSNIVETLLLNDCKVVGVDNFLTGSQKNLDEIKITVGDIKWSNFHFSELDINNSKEMKKLMSNCTYVCHQAALGSVPRSIDDPLTTHLNNVEGTLSLFNCARELGIKRVVYASSSSVYGDHKNLPKVEGKVGTVLSPYAATKKICEIYADAYAETYGGEFVGLRYFNVFGKRQDPGGAYAAVIPRWIKSIFNEHKTYINGDGQTSRDFTYIDNIVQLNILACLAESLPQRSLVLNGAYGQQISLNELFAILKMALNKPSQEPQYRDFREGDIRHSLADITLAKAILGYNPSFDVHEGIRLSVDWYKKNYSIVIIDEKT